MVAQKNGCATAQSKIGYTMLTIINLGCAIDSPVGTGNDAKGGTYTEKNNLNTNNYPPYSPPVGSAEDFDFVKLADEIINYAFEWQQGWIEMCCMRHHLARAEFRNVLQDFIGHRMCQGNTSKDFNDIMRHFENWYSTRKDINRKNEIFEQYAANRTNHSAERTAEERMAGYARVMQSILDGNQQTEEFADEILY